jgi:hypothetical protein
LSPLPDRIAELPVPTALVPHAARLALAIFFTAFAVMAVFYRWRALAVRVTLRVLSPISERFARWACERVDRLAQGLRFLPQRRFTGPFFALTLVYWFGNMAGTWLLGWACGFESFTFAQACVVVGVIGLGISLPSAPGFFGAYQVSMYAALAMFFAPNRIVNEGSVFVFLQYVIQVAIQLGFGMIALFVGGNSLRQELRAGAERT